ncbi:hypothetical protein PIB30_080727 [Stylosanthes scabra]|uniref:Reverse transcriptase RNase H-like domain-containing protein n=1 Tax=Stylosanthes scabra TaxID=79078 RepID=A0ABU6TUB0_9FABA|nr:hypothetical protein [Stylosanthes scabra]
MLDAKGKTLPDSQLMRWKDWFSRYKFTVKHIKGNHNIIADYLSRPNKDPLPKTLHIFTMNTFIFPLPDCPQDHRFYRRKANPFLKERLRCYNPYKMQSLYRTMMILKKQTHFPSPQNPKNPEERGYSLKVVSRSAIFANGSVILTISPDFTMRLTDPTLSQRIKIQVQLIGAIQDSAAEQATLHHQVLYYCGNGQYIFSINARCKRKDLFSFISDRQDPHD